MKKITIMTAILLSLLGFRAVSQVSGIVIDQYGKGVEYANVVMLSSTDSTFIEGTVTDTIGKFAFEKLRENDILLKLSCIGYKERIIKYDKAGAKVFLLEKDIKQLSEVTIKGAKPIVKTKNGKLSFTVSTLIKNKPVNNAFEAIAEVPGIQKDGDNISILGAMTTTVIINGRKSAMSYEQLVQYLKSVPADRIKNVEVMYATPPEYGVKGSSINVVIDNANPKKETKAEIFYTAKQAHYFNQETGASIIVSDKKSTLDASYGYTYNKIYTDIDLNAIHTVNGESEKYNIEQSSSGNTKAPAHKTHIGYNYIINPNSNINISYNMSLVDNTSLNNSAIKGLKDNNISSVTDMDSDDNLQNISFDYKNKNFSVGGDYVYYKSTYEQLLKNSDNSDNVNSNSSQEINKGVFFVNQKWKIGKSSSINIGSNVQYSNVKNKNTTKIEQPSDLHNNTPKPFNEVQKEQVIDGHIGLTQMIGTKGHLNVSLLYQYHKAKVEDKKTLWETNDLFPNLSFMWRFDNGNNLQLSFSSQKKYPAYWEMSPDVNYINPYISIAGNPNMKPEKMYSSQLMYLIKNKYIIQAFANISRDHIRQMLVQHSDRPAATYQSINFDKHDMLGLTAIVPVKLGKIIDSRFTLIGFSLSDKGQFEDIKFDRNKWIYRVEFSNNTTICKNVFLQVRGYYMSESMQGTYDVMPFYNLSVGGMWQATDRLSISINSEDLLGGQIAETETLYDTQNISQTINQDMKMVSLTIKYNFGGFKKREYRKADVSRMGM